MRKAILILAVCLLLAGCGKEKEEPTTLPAITAEVIVPEDEMVFTPCDEDVTAKEETNLRSYPSQGEDSTVLYTLKNGEVAIRVGISESGWSKVVFNGNTYYAVSSYLTTDLDYIPASQAETIQDEGINTIFRAVDETVTAKDVVNLRLLPSATNKDAKVVGRLTHGDTAQRIGISDNGWSKLKYKSETVYAVSTYLISLDGPETQPTEAADEDGDGIKTVFEPTNDVVTAKIEVNLRTLPSVTDKASKVVKTLKNGEAVTRTGINTDQGWSRVEYEGQTLYCVSSYLVLYTGPEK